MGHPLVVHKIASGRALRTAGRGRPERVGLSPVERFLTKYPSDLSGGQKQRAVIARAIILDPEVLVADEPVSMLDMSVRAKILQLMLDLKQELGLTYVYITHDLASAKYFCDRIAIMYLGRIVEIGPDRGDLRQPPAPVHQGAAQGDPRARPRPDGAARPAARRDPRRGRAAAGLLVPPALPRGHRRLRLGVARPAGAARGALDAQGRGLRARRRPSSATSTASTSPRPPHGSVPAARARYVRCSTASRPRTPTSRSGAASATSRTPATPSRSSSSPPTPPPSAAPAVSTSPASSTRPRADRRSDGDSSLRDGCNRRSSRERRTRRRLEVRERVNCAERVKWS